jgi:type I restriction enzyme M protein
VFKPYAGVSTALLIFTKGGTTENIWFYNMTSDGYGLDDKRGKLKYPDGSDDYGDLQDIIKHYKEKNSAPANDRLGKHFFVPKDEIVKADYDLSFSKYKVDTFENLFYDEPKVIIEKLNAIESFLTKELKSLESYF